MTLAIPNEAIEQVLMAVQQRMTRLSGEAHRAAARGEDSLFRYYHAAHGRLADVEVELRRRSALVGLAHRGAPGRPQTQKAPGEPGAYTR